jgi:hypothetical protein
MHDESKGIFAKALVYKAAGNGILVNSVRVTVEVVHGIVVIKNGLFKIREKSIRSDEGMEVTRESLL